MPLTGSRPPAPTVEECSDDEGILEPYFDGHASSHVAAQRSNSSDFDPKSVAGRKNHDGSDSGYSSKAGTSDDMSTTSMKKGGDLNIDTNSVERERRPYTSATSRSEETRSISPVKMKASKTEKSSKQPQTIRHPYGCPICDVHGYHVDFEREIVRPATTAPAPSQSQKRTKSPATKVRSKEESDGRPTTSRRSSSSSKRESRPVSMYGGFGPYGFPQIPAEYAHHMLAQNWQPAPNQMPQYNHYPYPYPQYAAAPGGYPHPQGFFDMSPMQYSHPPEPFFGDQNAVGSEDSSRKHRSSKKDKDGASTRTASRETKQRSATRSKPSAEADKISMPPPPKPDTARPVPRKAPTEYPSVQSRRYSVFTDEEDAHELQAALARERNTSQPRPPSSYKAPAGAEVQSRPRTRKSLSYNIPSATIQVASTLQRDIPRRRTDPYEQKLASAEDYVAKNNRKEAELAAHLAKLRKQQLEQHQRQRQQVRPQQPEIEFEQSSDEDYETQMPTRDETDFENFVAQLRNNKGAEVDGFIRASRQIEAGKHNSKNSRLSMKPSLTADALKIVEKQTGAMSDAGSVRSKHSSSRESAVGRVRAGTTVTSNSRMMNITTEDGISLSIPTDCGDVPLDIMLGNIRLSMNPVRNDEQPLDLKRIERAPSEISHNSRRSLAGEGVANASKGREEHQPRQMHSSYSSKRSSRAASASRPDKRETRSIDYSLLEPESYYLEY